MRIFLYFFLAFFCNLPFIVGEEKTSKFDDVLLVVH